ncbi:MAG: hypothetical protein AAB036_08735 [Elusimicrobiota bacterium]
MDVLKRWFKQAANPGYLTGALLIGVLGSGIGWNLWIRPLRDVSQRRYQAHQAMMRLYDLQMQYRAARGVFAGDIDTLLASTQDGERVRSILKANTDFTTLTVVGGEQSFRLEANVLDSERTIIKIRGPMGEPPRR